ncbi:MAG: hypothetical protein MJZ72_07090 [Bacteroidales bacterium]|nr:hypothetical protein [Bacteroidales bacterium]
MNNLKVGDFGIIYPQFKGKPKQAIKHLMKVKGGECTNSLYRKDIGYIDIVWGENDPKTNKGFGLKHIIEKHGESIKKLGFSIEDFIPIVIQYADLSTKKILRNRIVMENTNCRVVVKTTWNNKKKVFLLTAFDIRKKPD